jgi:hypothetical protein
MTQKSSSSSKQLRGVKEHATKKEIAIATQKVGFILRPDNHLFKQWVTDQRIGAHLDVVLQAQEKLHNFYKDFLLTKGADQ